MSMTQEDVLLNEQIEKDKKAFFDKYPNVKRSENIKVLNLIMKKEFAEAIIKGEKTVEYRAYSKHYSDRLYDKNLLDYGENYIKDEDMADFVDFARPLRKVETIHFHNYNNTWSLDVECVDNWTVLANQDGVEAMHDFGSDELDELVADLDKQKAKNRPIFFYFALGEILHREGI